MRKILRYKLLDAKATTGIDRVAEVSDFRHAVLYVSGSGSANLTVKFQGSLLEAKPNFTAAQSTANPWDYVQIKDLQNGATVDGDTGVVFAGSNDVRQFEVNTNGLEWLTANVTAIAAGNVTVELVLFNND